jgi:murein DD-endopeptidase MepM/ murein hydrolase activator NlpD
LQAGLQPPGAENRLSNVSAALRSGNRDIQARSAALLAAIGALLAALVLVGGASAQDLQSELDQTEAELEQEKDKKGVLSSELADYNARVDQLAGEVAILRNREAIVIGELRRTQARLNREKEHLDRLKEQLGRSLNVLRRRLVGIYRTGSPDLLTVMLESDGFDDLVSRYEYLRRIEEQDSSIVSRVRTLRNGTRLTVEQVTDDRNEIEEKKAELERTRAQLEAREAELATVRDQKAAALDEVESNIEQLEGDVSHLQDQIQQQIQAASATPGVEPLQAGPVQGASGGWIWPVNGTLTSPFGYRWGRMHEGIDISVPEGTPIRAAKPGRVILAAYTGGYGNYTCVDHGGGLSTCYAHQSSYAVSSGDTVDQGEVIGYSGNTGSSTGPHLHFEIRVNGSAVDPLGYL